MDATVFLVMPHICERSDGAMYSANSSRIAAQVSAPVDNLIAPKPLNIKLVQLTESTCKWPLGDPQEENFAF